MSKLQLSKFNLIWISTIGLLLISHTSCIDPLDVEPSDFDEFLVVQGFINDDFGPHQFRISRVTRFASIREGGFIQIEEAQVGIIDQNGVRTPLRRLTLQRKELIPLDEPHPIPCGPIWMTFVEIRTDYLTPADFKGEIGNTYVLEIITKDGNTYRSEPQTIVPTPPIESVQLEFLETPNPNQGLPNSGVEIYSTWQDPVEEENYYFWRVNGIYHINSPDLSAATRCCTYDPKRQRRSQLLDH